MTGSYETRFTPDGTGNWEVQLPADATLEDLEALSPVIAAMRAFLKPTVDVVNPS